MSSSPIDRQSSSETSLVHNLADVLARRDSFVIPNELTDWLGLRKPVWVILLLITLIADDKIEDRSGTQKAPSVRALTSHEARMGVVRRLGTTADLFLTMDALNKEVEITGALLTALSRFMLSHGVVPMGEMVTTVNVVAPIFDIWLAMWTQGSKVGLKAEWSTQANKPSQGRGDVDIAVQCVVKRDVIIEAAVLEAKSPQACGHEDIENYGISSNGMTIGRQVIKHAIEAEKIMRDHWPSVLQRPILAGLVVFPAHFYPGAYKDMDLVVFENAIDTTHRDWPDAINHLENMMRFTEVVGAWTLAVLINADNKFSGMWRTGCEEQVKQAEQFLTTSGERLATGHRFATLMWVWTVVCIALHQAVTLCVLSTVKIRRFTSILLPDGKRLDMDSSGLKFQFPFRLCLPYPDACDESGNSQIYMFSLPKIVIKIISDPVAYERELAFYTKWTPLQGSGIPRLLASGACFGNDLCFLILSHEGEQVTKLAQEDHAVLEKTVLGPIHEGGWHHHDLAPRNVVRSASGRVCLIDFGEAAECMQSGCEDSWSLA